MVRWRGGWFVAALTLAGCDCGARSHEPDAGTVQQADAATDAQDPESGDAGPDAGTHPFVDPDAPRCTQGMEPAPHCPAELPFCCQWWDTWSSKGGPVGDGFCAATAQEGHDEFTHLYCDRMPDSCSIDLGPDCPSADADEDGHEAASCGGDDCADDDAAIHPGAPDQVEDDVWSRETVRLGAGGGWTRERRITVDGAGVPHVLWVDHSARGLPYSISTREGDGWSPHELWGDPAFGAALAVAPGHDPKVVVQEATDAGAHSLWLLQPPNGEPEAIAEYAPPIGLLLAVEPATGMAELVVHEGFDRDVLREANAWQPERIRVGGALDGRSGEALAVDADGALHLAIVSAGDLWYVTNRSGEWTTELVDCVLDSVRPSIGSDSYGRAHIVYTRWNSRSLWYATNSSGSFAREPVTAARVPDSGRIAVGPDDSVHVAYLTTMDFDSSSQMLLYAVRQAGGWSSRLVARHANEEDLVATGGGEIHLAYDRRLVAIPDLPGEVEYAHASSSPRVDQNCDGIDGIDADQDGWASVASGGEDCDDESRWIRPDRTGDVDNDIDENCNGLDGDDLDGDGFVAMALGGDDCDDADRTEHPGATDPLDDGRDRDCDGLDD